MGYRPPYHLQLRKSYAPFLRGLQQLHKQAYPITTCLLAHSLIRQFEPLFCGSRHPSLPPRVSPLLKLSLNLFPLVATIRLHWDAQIYHTLT